MSDKKQKIKKVIREAIDKTISYYDIVKAKKSKNKDSITESSLGRLYQHFLKTKKNSFGIATSWRLKNSDGTERSKKENLDTLKQFKSDIRELDLGYFEMMGVGQEKDEEENVIESKEPSFFIPGISLKNLKALMNKYEQDFAIYSGPETLKDGKEQIAFLSSNGDMELGGTFHPMKIAKFYSKIKGKPFVFTESEPCNLMAKMVEFNLLEREDE